jgi:hypothetical protein
VKNLQDRIASENGLILVSTIARLLFASLVFSYFVTSAELEPLSLSGHLLFWGYLAAQIGLLAKVIPAREWLALILDAGAITFAVALDPSSPAPTLALYLISLMSAGLLRGLTSFFLMLCLNAALVATLLLTQQQAGEPVAYANVFLLALVCVCAVYLGVLIYRNAVLTKKAQEATWSDPETGLISHHALVATAGWLLPLHDRLAANLTVALIQPAQAGQLSALSDLLAARLRKSDVASRYDRNVIALLLPCTTLTAAENLLGDLRNSTLPFYASIITLSNDRHGLEETLVQLEQHLGRAIGNAEHWLAHAPAPALA